MLLAFLYERGNLMKIYENRKVVLLTKHKKEEVIKPILEEVLGCTLLVENRFDTDKFGTFTREIKRPKSQLDTARMKIEKGLRISKESIGISSEGSFGSHPFAPVQWNTELVLFYDKSDNLEIFGIYEGPDTNCDETIVKSYEEAVEFSNRIGFPDHYVIMRPDHNKSKFILKNIDSYEKLRDSYEKCLKKSKTKCVHIETDMRAFANPTRMKNIQKATENLVEKLMITCPECGAPGFQIQEVIRGLPCEMCGFPSEMAKAYIHVCHRCKYKYVKNNPKGMSSPAQYCERCNP